MALSADQQKVYDKIVADLGADESDARRWAIYDLEKFPPEMIVDHLVAGTRDEHRAVREAASEVLENVPSDLCLPLLTPLLGDKRIEVRNLVAALISKFGDGAVRYLIAALKVDDEDVRKFSADILGLAHSSDAVEGLAKAIYDPVFNVGVSAAEALGKIKSPKALPFLMEAYTKRDYVRRECAEAIGLLGVPEGAHFLAGKVMDEPDLLVQYAIVDGLGNSGDEQTLDFLDANASSFSEMLREPVALAYLKIAKRVQINPLQRETVPLDMLIAGAAAEEEDYGSLLMECFTPGVNSEILLAFSEIHDQLSSPVLVALVKASTGKEELLKFSEQMIKHADDWVAYTAIESFSPASEARLVEVVRRVLAGDRTMPQMAAMKKIQEAELPDARGLVDAFLDSDDEDLRSLARTLVG